MAFLRTSFVAYWEEAKLRTTTSGLLGYKCRDLGPGMEESSIRIQREGINGPARSLEMERRDLVP